MGRPRLLVAALVIMASVAAAPTALPAPTAETPIQPGARVLNPYHNCTLNFVFRDPAGRLSIGLAGHCVKTVGERVVAPAPVGEIGTTTFRVVEGKDDFALVRIDREKLPLVNPQMRKFGGPTGVLGADDEWTAGDGVNIFGQGRVLGDVPATQGRTGKLNTIDDQAFRALIVTAPGDSGAPVLHESGRALGVMAGVPIPPAPSSAQGTTIERILGLLGAAGMPHTLVTAPHPA